MFRLATAVVRAVTLSGTGTARASQESSSGDGTSQAFAEIMQTILQILESSGKSGSATSDLRGITSGSQAPGASDFNKVLNAVEREAGDDQFLRNFSKQLRSQMAASAPAVIAAAPALAPTYSPAPRTTNSASPAGRDRWECGVQTTCVGDCARRTADEGHAQLSLASPQGNVVAYMNVY